MKKIKSIPALILAALLLPGLCAPASASENSLQSAAEETAACVYRAVPNPQVGSIGGEWAVLGLARSGCSVPEEYYQDYYETVKTCVAACKGVLSEKKYTEYSRVIVALTAIGKDPAEVAGYNLLTPLGDFERTVWQGINGPVWALIALDCGDYAMPQNSSAETQATRQKYVDEILRRQLESGGWNLSDEGGIGSADADITGMALQALAKYQEQPAVKAATERALACLSAMQNSDGGFASWGTENCESAAQVIVALCELGIPLDDSRFVKNGATLLDSLLSFRNTDGSFRHTSSGSGNSQMSTEQGFYGLVAALRASSGKTSLYRMTDALSVSDGSGTKKGEGLAGKNADVRAMPVTAPGLSFDDIIYSESRTAIEALAARGIIGGRGNGAFDPDAGMTRAEFAAISVRALGLSAKDTGTFSDVTPDSWCAGYVGSASSYGIINGVGGGLFNPGGTLTRQEAAVMVARAAKLCGMDTALGASAIRDTLAQFGDYVTVADWARESMAFCYKEDILSQSALNVEPSRPVLRGEIAQMLFNMLSRANLV